MARAPYPFAVFIASNRAGYRYNDRLPVKYVEIIEPMPTIINEFNYLSDGNRNGKTHGNLKKCAF